MAASILDQASSPLLVKAHQVGMDIQAPYGVYVNGKQVATFKCESDAVKHYSQLRLSLMTPVQRQREKDRARHALQAPIASPKYRVLYLKNGKEHRSPWLYRQEHANKGLELMRAKYGQKNAIIYVD